MSDTPAKPPTEATDPVETIQRAEGPVGPTTPHLVAFHYSGTLNGLEQADFDSRVVNIPDSLLIATQKEVKDIAEALAYSIFQDGKRLIGLKLAILNIQRLPIGSSHDPFKLVTVGTPVE